MRKTILAPKAKLMASFIGAMMFIFFISVIPAKAQEHTKQTKEEGSLVKKNPCDSSQPMPIFKSIKPVQKRMPGANGVYVECNPSIVINLPYERYLEREKLLTQLVEAKNNQDASFSIWELLMVIGMFAIIFYLFLDRVNNNQKDTARQNSTPSTPLSPITNSYSPIIEIHFHGEKPEIKQIPGVSAEKKD